MSIEVDIEAGRALADRLAAARGGAGTAGAPAADRAGAGAGCGARGASRGQTGGPGGVGQADAIRAPGAVSIQAAVESSLAQWQRLWQEADVQVGSLAQRMHTCMDRYAEVNDSAAQALQRLRHRVCGRP